MIVALTALVIASGGTAVAASSLVNGDTLIKKGTLSGNRLRKHTITGTQLNLKKLGKVPSAEKADAATKAQAAANAGHATTADKATLATNASNATNATDAINATNATNATNAGNAGTVGGQTVTKIFKKLPMGAATAEIYSRNGLLLSAGCTAGGTPIFTARGPSTAEMQVEGVASDDSPFSSESNGFTTAVDLTQGNTTGAAGLSYANASGQVVTVSYGFDQSPNFGSTNTGCAITGTAIASS